MHSVLLYQRTTSSKLLGRVNCAITTQQLTWCVRGSTRHLGFDCGTKKAAICLQATNTDLANRLYNTPEIFKSSRFSKPKLSQTGFQIEHYAGAVGYKTDNFLVSQHMLPPSPVFLVYDHPADLVMLCVQPFSPEC